MMHRLRQLLRGRLPGGQSVAPARPNELRLETVRAERLRREALQRTAEAQQEDPIARSQRRPEPAPAGERRPELNKGIDPNQRAALRTRSGLRQALLLKEILDRPVSLREPDDVGGRMWDGAGNAGNRPAALTCDVRVDERRREELRS